MKKITSALNRYLTLSKKYHIFLYSVFVIIGISLLIIGVTFLKGLDTQKKLEIKNKENLKLSKTLASINKDFEVLKNQDQYKRNETLQKEIKSIQTTYADTISAYESLTDLSSSTKELPKYREYFAQILKYLSEKNYTSASAKLTTLKADIEKTKTALAANLPGIADISNIPANNAPPAGGFRRQRVDVNGQSFIVDLVAGDISTTRIIVDTASDSDCKDNCPVLSLGEYVSRNGAYAGVNGSYFCPADYPSCAGKSNTFDTLAMNKNKHYLNSDNNVYSTVPAVIFGSGFVRFVGRSLDWGRDTEVDGVLANQPLLVSGGNVVFGGDGDPKKGSNGNRSFVANKGNIVYIGVLHNVTVAQGALVLKAMGMDNALNLDSGGSTALWAGGGYKDGPGRNIPNAILFINK